MKIYSSEVKKGGYRFKLIWLDYRRLFLKTGENSWVFNVWKIRIIIRNTVEITAYSIVFRIKEGFIKSSIWLSPHPRDSSLIVWILLNDWLMIGCSPCLLVMWWPPPFGHKDLKHPQEELAKDRWWLSDCLCQSCGTSHEGLSDTAWFHIQCSRLDSEKVKKLVKCFNKDFGFYGLIILSRPAQLILSCLIKIVKGDSLKHDDIDNAVPGLYCW